jgi:hypothetical protein
MTARQTIRQRRRTRPGPHIDTCVILLSSQETSHPSSRTPSKRANSRHTRRKDAVEEGAPVCPSPHGEAVCSGPGEGTRGELPAHHVRGEQEVTGVLPELPNAGQTWWGGGILHYLSETDGSAQEDGAQPNAPEPELPPDTTTILNPERIRADRPFERQPEELGPDDGPG